jgi:hypothetical protein
VLPDGSVVNKTGTRAAALAAHREGVPLYAVALTDRVATDETVPLESGDRAAVYDGDAPVDVRNPTFDVTPPDLVERVVTERGGCRLTRSAMWPTNSAVWPSERRAMRADPRRRRSVLLNSDIYRYVRIYRNGSRE